MGRLPRRIDALPALLTVLLISFGVVLACAVAAGELLKLAEAPGGSTGLDSSVTRWVVDHRTHALTTLARALSTVGSQKVLLPLVVLTLVALLWRREFVSAAFLVATWGGALLLYSLTKGFVDRPRPPRSLWLTDVGRSSSFPSGHATQSLATLTALALVSALWLPRWRWAARALALLLAAGIGSSRVYLGVHWLTDVGAGWLIGAAWIMIVAALAEVARSAERRRRPAPQAVTRNG